MADGWIPKKHFVQKPMDLYAQMLKKRKLELIEPIAENKRPSKKQHQDMMNYYKLKRRAEDSSDEIMKKFRSNDALAIEEHHIKTKIPKKLLQEAFNIVAENVREAVESANLVHFTTPPSNRDIMAKVRSMGLKKEIELRESQFDGIKFMMYKEKLGYGSILAHEMGLGKTLVTLTLERITYDTEPGVTLVVTPTNVNTNWVQDSQKFFGNKIRMILYYGENKPWYSYKPNFGPKGEKRTRPLETWDIEAHDLLIVHYEAIATIWKKRVKDPIKNYLKTLTMENLGQYSGEKGDVQKDMLEQKFHALDWSDFERSRANSNWVNVSIKRDNKSVKMVGSVLGFYYKRIVCDEGHRMKNCKTQTAQMCATINAKYKHALSGTPDFNMITDLWSILNFIRVPNLITEKEFSDSAGVLKKVAGINNMGQTSMSQVLEKIDILRTKINSGEMLNWNENKARVIIDLMDEWMQKITKNSIALATKDLESMIVEKTKYEEDGWDILHFAIEGIPAAYSKVIRFDVPPVMKVIHESIRQKKREELNRGDIQNQGAFLFETITHLQKLISNPRDVDPAIYEKYCNPELVTELLAMPVPKIEMIIRYKEEYMSDGKKGLIFCKFKGAVERIHRELSEYGIKCVFVTGDIKQEARGDIYQEFKSDPDCVFLITTHCSATGINLTEGCHVIFEIPSWNKAEDRQCYSRTHRKGQQDEVRVAYLVARDTIDENVIRKAESKEMLGSSISIKDKRDILGY